MGFQICRKTAKLAKNRQNPGLALIAKN